jgi:hypothetical protein
VGHTYQARKAPNEMKPGFRPLRCVIKICGNEVTYLANIGAFAFNKTNVTRFQRWALRDVTGIL